MQVEVFWTLLMNQIISNSQGCAGQSTSNYSLCSIRTLNELVRWAIRQHAATHTGGNNDNDNDNEATKRRKTD